MILMWVSRDASYMQEGRHVIPQEEEKFTPEQLQVMKTQDLKYVQMKHQTEKNVSNRAI